MTKQLKSDKNSFTLLETLISILLLSIVVVGFSKDSYYDNFDREYMKLNEIENSFNIDSYNKNFTQTSKTIKVIKNDTSTENISINVKTYTDESISLYKYRLK